MVLYADNHPVATPLLRAFLEIGNHPLERLIEEVPGGTPRPVKTRMTDAPSAAATSIHSFTIATSLLRAAASGTAKSFRTPVPKMVTPFRKLAFQSIAEGVVAPVRVSGKVVTGRVEPVDAMLGAVVDYVASVIDPSRSGSLKE